MNLKKILRSTEAQAIVEYILIFIVLAAGIILVFGGFGRINLTSTFNSAVETAIQTIKE